jgi:hypothetical protein
MGKFVKKTSDAAPANASTEGPKAPRGYVDGRRYLAVLETAKALSAQLDQLGKGLGASADEVIQIEEARRQEGATYDFNLKMKRDGQLAAFAKEDAEREAAFEQREKALSAAETDFGELVGVEPTAGDHLATGKALRTAYAAKLDAMYRDGEKDGKEAAVASAQLQKQIADANAKTDLELLRQENKQLKERVAALELQNKGLLEQQQKTADTIASVAKGAFDAAGGVVAKGNEALGTAAGAGNGGLRSR